MNNPFTKGEKCRVVNDWLPSDAKKKRVAIEDFQKNGRLTFARVRWVGSGTKDFAQEYGILFPLDELRKV